MLVGEGVKEGIMLEVDLLEKRLETDPSAILLRWCASRCCVASGSRCSISKRVETITGGSGEILKLGGIWLGIMEKRRKVSFWSLMWSSRDKESATSFSFPGNHWEYSFSWFSNVREEWSRAHVNFSPVCTFDSVGSLKLERRSQPSVVELSVWERMQSRGVVFCSRISIQGPIVDAMNSRKFRVARKWRWVGIRNRQARPRWEKPPKP